MEQSLTFNDLPSAVTMLTKEVSELKRLIIEKQEQPPIEQTEQLLNVQEAAKLLHLSVPTLYSKHSKNELPGVSKRGKRLYFSRTSLVEWVKQGVKKTNAEIKQETEDYLSNSKKK